MNPIDHSSYSLPPSRRGGWARVSVYLIVCLALAALFYQVFRPAGADHIPWLTSLDDALVLARRTGKPVLLDFSASWCPPCQEMKRRSWPDSQVGALVKRGYIPVLMDVDRPEAQSAAQKYGVQYIPALFILDAEGNVLQRGEFMSRDELVKFLGRVSNAG